MIDGQETTEAMHVTDLALNQLLGLQSARGDERHSCLELPESTLTLNHLGSVHASAQFALAEACSGQFLLDQLDHSSNQPFALLRTSTVKFRKPAHGSLHASARFADSAGEGLCAELASRGRALASVLVEVTDGASTVTMAGQFDWFLQRTG